MRFSRGRQPEEFTTARHDTGDDTTVRRIRGFLLGLFVVGASGTGIELLLLGHTEDFWQLLPLGLIGLGGAALAWYAATGGSTSLGLFRNRPRLGIKGESLPRGTWYRQRDRRGRPLESVPTGRRPGRAPWRRGSGGAPAGSATWCCGCCVANRWRLSGGRGDHRLEAWRDGPWLASSSA